MSQTFKMPPRQIGFKPNAVRLNPTASASSASDEQIRQLSLQIQQIATRLRLQQERLAQLKIPQIRQTTEVQIQVLQKELAELKQNLNILRSEQRCNLLSELQADDFDLLKAIYLSKQPLEQRAQGLFEDWFDQAHKLDSKSPNPAQSTAVLAFQSLIQILMPVEAEALKNWWKHPSEAHSPLAETIKAQSQTETDDEQAQFELLTFEEQGPIEIQFDLQARKSVVRNQMGITLNQPQKSYQEYLEIGFAAIDVTVSSQFKLREPLKEAVEAFLEAVSLDRSRYEAYFGLGYLYSLIKDLNHSLYFLDLAWKISGDPTISEMITQVKQSNSLPV